MAGGGGGGGGGGGRLLSSSCDTVSRFGECRHLMTLIEVSDAPFAVRCIRLQWEGRLFSPGRESGVLCSRSERSISRREVARASAPKASFGAGESALTFFGGEISAALIGYRSRVAAKEKKDDGPKAFWSDIPPLLRLVCKRGGSRSTRPRCETSWKHSNCIVESRFWGKSRPGKILVYSFFYLVLTFFQLTRNY